MVSSPRFFSAVILLTLFSFPAWTENSLDFDLGLTEGQISPRLDASWDWSPDLAGRLSITTGNDTEFAEAPLDGYPAAVTTVTRAVSLRLDPAVYLLSAGPLALGGGLGLAGEYENRREIGYVDLTDVSGSPRMFFNNIQGLTTLMPHLRAEASVGDGSFRSTVSGSWAPWNYIYLDHDLSSSTVPSSPLYDTPRTRRSFTGNGANLWQVNAGFRGALGFLNLGVKGQVSGRELHYEVLKLGGGSDRMDVNRLEASAELLASSTLVRIAGLEPRLGVGYFWSEESGDDAGSGSFSFSFGFAGGKGE